MIADAAGPGLLEQIIEAATRRDAGAEGRLAEFLAEPSPARALRLWAGPELAADPPRSPGALARRLSRDVAWLDEFITDQVNEILHHPRVQQLEASWRGLRYLVDQVDPGENVRVRVLSLSFEALARDLDRAVEFDQSSLFRKVYSEHFGIAGGEPFSVLIGDYQVRHQASADHPWNDVAVLRAVSGVAAAAFAPFIAGTHPALLGLDSFSGLQRQFALPETFQAAEYAAWRSFRETEDARFVALTLPLVLARLPWTDDPQRIDGFRFREHVSGPGARRYLWGNAVYAFAAVLARAFAETGWLADIRGVRPDEDAAGLVSTLPVDWFPTDRAGIAAKPSVDVMLTEQQEKELGDLGFVPLCHCHGTALAAFHTTSSVQRPLTYDDPAATVNARLSSMLQYILCVSRFAHHLKVLAREKIGTTLDAEELENRLQQWVYRYVTGDEKASREVKARFPLREAQIQVREQPDRPGHFTCVMQLRPHFQLDALVASVRLVAELGRPEMNRAA
jgi:type VI secretion system ImpC/EvpB family protein